MVHVWSGNEPFGVQLRASSSFTGQKKYYDYGMGAPERVKEGIHLEKCAAPQGVAAESHTLVPKLDLNQPAWELRTVQPRRVNPWFRVPKEDRDMPDDPLLYCLLCHQSRGCARNACAVCRQKGCSYLWDPNASLGNAVYTLFPFSGPRLAHWCWGKHKVLLSVQISGSTRGS